MKKKGKKMVPNCVPTNENISFDIGGNKLSSSQEKLHKMSPEQRSQLPQKMVKKLVGLRSTTIKIFSRIFNKACRFIFWLEKRYFRAIWS
jgi:hypothetical protein